jgi:hypothetical protein
MRWFRSHSGVSSGLALFSLALQLALSFGHIHLKDSLGTAHSAAPIDTGVSRAIPADGESDQHEREYCAVYAVNALIGTAQDPAPPMIELPAIVGAMRLAYGHQFRLAESRHVLSQARAPPIA